MMMTMIMVMIARGGASFELVLVICNVGKSRGGDMAKKSGARRLQYHKNCDGGCCQLHSGIPIYVTITIADTDSAAADYRTLYRECSASSCEHGCSRDQNHDQLMFSHGNFTAKMILQRFAITIVSSILTGRDGDGCH